MWKFREIQVGELEKNPQESEFFKSDNPSDSLVREFVQNSLDAILNENEKIKINFTFGYKQKNEFYKFIDGLVPHLESSGYMTPQIKHITKIPFLTIEDFNTTGLDGPTEPQEINSNFYNFWWREGISKKEGKKAGRWGLGKITYHNTSKIRTIWGLTSRCDDNKQLLLGKCSLKVHKIENIRYPYYGYYAETNYLPISNEAKLIEFKKMFSLTRKNENGFSLVLPFYNDEISYNLILKAIIINYSFAILYNMLEVNFKDIDKNLHLNSENLVEVAINKINWQDTAWEKIDVKAFLIFISEALSNKQYYDINHTINTKEIDNESFGNNYVIIKDKFENGDILCFKIPVQIKKIGFQPVNSYFRIIIKKDIDINKPQELYVRSGITISGIKTLGNRPIRSILIADDSPIESFLGDSETPAHTEWNERTEGFKEKYIDAVATLRAIKKTLNNIVELLDKPPQELQKDLLHDIFSIPFSETDDISKVKDKTKKPVVDVNKKNRDFIVRKIPGGFNISLVNAEQAFPRKAILKIAYDIRSGNPFKKYDKLDFDLYEDKIEIYFSNCTITKKENNVIEFNIINDKMNMELLGFDPNRDLVIDIKWEDYNNET